jgi:hypothetical protein
MHTNTLRATAILGVLTLGAFFSSTARAGCDMTTPPAGGRFLAISNHGEEHFGPPLWESPIVGLWAFTFTADGAPPEAPPVDKGFVTWHADGTELMNSGRAPMTGSFCMGVWKQVGRATFVLNHWALSWDDTGTVFVGPTNIRERVTVDRNGKRYSGTFTLTQYDAKGKNAIGGVSGTVSATRITAD